MDLGPERGGRRKRKGEKRVQRPWRCLFVPFVMGPRSLLDNVHVTHCLFPPALTLFSPGCKDSYPSCSETDTEVTRGRRLTPRGLPSVGRGPVPWEGMWARPQERVTEVRLVTGHYPVTLTQTCWQQLTAGEASHLLPGFLPPSPLSRRRTKHKKSENWGPWRCVCSSVRWGDGCGGEGRLSLRLAGH